MSISSLMSNDEEPVPRHVSHSRRSSRHSNGHVVKQERPPSPPPPQHLPADNVPPTAKAPASTNGEVLTPAPVQMAAGNAKTKADEHAVETVLAQIEADADLSLDPDARIAWRDDYVQRSNKRAHALSEIEANKRKVCA